MIQRNGVAFRDTPEFKRGRSGEHIVAQELQRRGYYVVPSYDYSGEDNNKAPRLLGSLDGFVIPDLDIAKSGCRMWTEVKTKAAPTYTRVTGRYEHGISAVHWSNYFRVQEITGTEAWLTIYEESSGDVLIQKMDTLRQPTWYGGPREAWFQGPMIYFARDAFRRMFNINQPRGKWHGGMSLYSSGDDWELTNLPISGIRRP